MSPLTIKITSNITFKSPREHFDKETISKISLKANNDLINQIK